MKHSSSKIWVGFDLGGTKMLATVFDHNLEMRSMERAKTKAHEGVESTLQRMRDLIGKALEAADVRHPRLAGIGIGLPGALDLKRATVIDAPNLGWKNVRIGRLLSAKYKCPVAVANDVDAGVYGEYARGAARGARCAIGIFPGTGVGGGCVYEGRLLTGGTRSCMEIGHVEMIPNGPLCGCGRHGCLEAVASRLAIASAAAAAACRGAAPYLMKHTGADVSAIRSGALAASVRAGDKAVIEIIKSAAAYVGRAAALCVNLLSPDVIVLGGGLVEAMPQLYASEVERAANATVMPAYRGSYRIAVASLGDDAVATGAAAWARTVIDGAPPQAEPSPSRGRRK